VALGPVQIIAIGFDSLDRLRGQVLDAVDELTPLGAARILDALFVGRDESGDLLALEAGDVGLDSDDEELGFLVGQLLGFSFEGDGTDGAGDETDELGSVMGMSAAEIQRIGDDLAPGTGALLLLVEHRWAIGLRDAIADAGGRLIAQGFLTPDAMFVLGAEAMATAEAIDAIETALELEAEATLRSIAALATIEIAEEIQAAVVADTILTLVEAGFIEKVAAEHAASAVIDAAVIEQAAANRTDGV
jgi:hypothetical protein